MFKKLKDLFNSTPASEYQIVYKDFIIKAKPKKIRGSFTTEGIISKEISGSYLEKAFIRTDTFSKKEDAVELSQRKAKIIIDELGESIFKKDWL
ncbi:MAG: HlyU family transcriptional regulator [Alphaproteobacteria bacterium]|jgi:hypothetical protein|uniref:Uncharacterized protein n=1 Tax=PS1 clade bacterium TaxID=2175152 RepID=A0A368DTV5_9PROT|nr:MAG: hypothetical protein DBW71_00370 [PS1 clade bacterium]|tara:strand:+ start:140 stop:421 length:282 start_codon:yes stop_codon:yes gene_type:complete